MGVVWIDQLVAWKNEGRMDPSITPALPAPGLPIYPLYLVVPREAANREARRATSTTSRRRRYRQGDRRAVRLVSGRRRRSRASADRPKSQELLFKGVSAADLARYSRQMPIKEYHDLITLAYEEIVR